MNQACKGKVSKGGMNELRIEWANEPLSRGGGGRRHIPYDGRYDSVQ